MKHKDVVCAPKPPKFAAGTHVRAGTPSRIWCVIDSKYVRKGYTYALESVGNKEPEFGIARENYLEATEEEISQ